MTMINEKDFKKAGMKGDISKDDFLQGLREITTGGEKSNGSHKGYDAFKIMTELLGTIVVEIRNQSKTVPKVILGPEMMKLTKAQPIPQQILEWKFTVERNSRDKILSITAKARI